MEVTWACACGEEFGNYGLLMAHRRAQKRAGEPCPPGMEARDAETGRVLARSLSEARARGLVTPGKPREGKRRVTEPTTAGSPFKGSMSPVRVDLPAGLWPLFEVARLKFPGAYSNDGAGLARWITHCVFTLYRLLPEELGLNILVNATAAGGREEGVA